MIRLLDWFTARWSTWSHPVRIVFLTVCAAFAFGAGVIVGPPLLRGWIARQFSNVPTKQDLSLEFDSLKTESAEQTMNVVQQAFSTYTDSLGRVRDSIEANILQPMLMNQVDLARRLARVESTQGITNDRLSTMSQVTSQKLERLVQTTERDDSQTQMNATLQAILDRLEALERQPEEEPKKSRRKTNPQTY